MAAMRKLEKTSLLSHSSSDSALGGGDPGPHLMASRHSNAKPPQSFREELEHQVRGFEHHVIAAQFDDQRRVVKYLGRVRRPRDFGKLQSYAYLWFLRGTAIKARALLWTLFFCALASLLGYARCPEDSEDAPDWRRSLCFPIIDSSRDEILIFASLAAFLLSLFAGQTFSRWWKTRELVGIVIARAASFATMVMAYVKGSDPATVAVRETLVRYSNLAHALVYKQASMDDDLTELVQRGLLTEREMAALKPLPSRYAMVYAWLLQLVTQVFDAGRCPYGILHLFHGEIVQMRTAASDIFMFLNCQIPYAYVHMVILICKLHLSFVFVYSANLIGIAARDDSLYRSEPWRGVEHVTGAILKLNEHHPYPDFFATYAKESQEAGAAPEPQALRTASSEPAAPAGSAAVSAAAVAAAASLLSSMGVAPAAAAAAAAAAALPRAQSFRTAPSTAGRPAPAPAAAAAAAASSAIAGATAVEDVQYHSSSEEEGGRPAPPAPTAVPRPASDPEAISSLLEAHPPAAALVPARSNAAGGGVPQILFSSLLGSGPASASASASAAAAPLGSIPESALPAAATLAVPHAPFELGGSGGGGLGGMRKSHTMDEGIARYASEIQDVAAAVVAAAAAAEAGAAAAAHAAHAGAAAAAAAAAGTSGGSALPEELEASGGESAGADSSTLPEPPVRFAAGALMASGPGPAGEDDSSETASVASAPAAPGDNRRRVHAGSGGGAGAGPSHAGSSSSSSSRRHGHGHGHHSAVAQPGTPRTGGARARAWPSARGGHSDPRPRRRAEATVHGPHAPTTPPPPRGPPSPSPRPSSSSPRRRRGPAPPSARLGQSSPSFGAPRRAGASGVRVGGGYRPAYGAAGGYVYVPAAPQAVAAVPASGGSRRRGARPSSNKAMFDQHMPADFAF
eukprot:tig00020563_g11328.t1